jgi:hypothetical protein
MVRRVLLTWLLLLPAAASAQTSAQTAQLTAARHAFNQGQYEQAIAAALEARRVVSLAAPASVVLGRAYIERFHLKSEGGDLALAHNVLFDIDPAQLSPSERRDLSIGLGLTVFFEGRPGAAAELLEVALSGAAVATPALDARAREKLFDWWATAVDRAAQLAPETGRRHYYERIVGRSESELARDPSSLAAGYWLAAGARGAAELDRAWDAAIAAWIRARHAPVKAGGDKGIAADGQVARGTRDLNDARADLDLLMTAAIIPERARALDPRAAVALIAAMRSEWEQIKSSW